MPDSLSLVWGHLVHFAKFPILQFFKLCSSLNFQLISSKPYARYPNHGAIQGVIFWQSAKNKKIWHFEIFRNIGPYAAGNFKVLFLPQFSLEFKNIGYHGRCKCLLEYCNEKLASST